MVFFTPSRVFTAVSCSFMPSIIHAIELAIAESHANCRESFCWDCHQLLACFVLLTGFKSSTVQLLESLILKSWMALSSFSAEFAFWVSWVPALKSSKCEKQITDPFGRIHSHLLQLHVHMKYSIVHVCGVPLSAGAERWH